MVHWVFDRTESSWAACWLPPLISEHLNTERAAGQQSRQHTRQGQCTLPPTPKKHTRTLPIACIQKLELWQMPLRTPRSFQPVVNDTCTHTRSRVRDSSSRRPAHVQQTQLTGTCATLAIRPHSLHNVIEKAAAAGAHELKLQNPGLPCKEITNRSTPKRKQH